MSQEKQMEGKFKNGITTKKPPKPVIILKWFDFWIKKIQIQI